jgi:F-type H+-transporting ATPase subunit b
MGFLNPQFLLSQFSVALTEAMVPRGRIFELDQQTVISSLIVLFNVLLLAFVMSKLLYKPVRQFLFDRTSRIHDQLRRAEESESSANALKTEYEQAMKSVDKERNEILEMARKLAADRTREQVAEARHEADAIKSRAMREIDMERERAGDEIKQACIDISALMVSKFLTKEIDAATHERLFTETMAELEGMAWHN